LIAAATALVLLGGSIMPFLSPIFVRLEQDRTAAGAWSGYSAAQLDQVTGSILGDLVLWRGDFGVTLEGARVLKAPEIDHMLDVRGVFAGFFALVLAGVAVLAVAFRRRGTDARAATWRAVATGASGLAIAIAVVSAFTVFAFDAAFEVFHRLFFSAGSYTFDPRTDKLVQLFPEAFWSETAMFVGVVVLVAAIVVWWVARRRAASRASAGGAITSEVA
jgi:integral membrane protein (TIGR01906 family)